MSALLFARVFLELATRSGDVVDLLLWLPLVCWALYAALRCRCVRTHLQPADNVHFGRIAPNNAYPYWTFDQCGKDKNRHSIHLSKSNIESPKNKQKNQCLECFPCPFTFAAALTTTRQRHSCRASDRNLLVPACGPPIYAAHFSGGACFSAALLSRLLRREVEQEPVSPPRQKTRC